MITVHQEFYILAGVIRFELTQCDDLDSLYYNGKPQIMLLQQSINYVNEVEVIIRPSPSPSRLGSWPKNFSEPYMGKGEGRVRARK